MSLSQNWKNLMLSMKSTSAAAVRDKSKHRKPLKGRVSKATGGRAKDQKSVLLGKTTTGPFRSAKLDSNLDRSNTNQLESTGDETLVEGVSKRSGKGSTDIGRYVAIDCEFVGVGPEGKEHALARVSIVNYHGNVVMDEYVRPKERVVDWRTKVSGIKPSDMVNAIPFELAQERCAKIIKDRVLVGHDLRHDLDALLLSHPRSMIRDTALHVPYRRKYSKGRKPSLKKLASEILKRNIQMGQHSSVEDARVTMLLYKNEKKEFERLNHHYIVKDLRKAASTESVVT